MVISKPRALVTGDRGFLGRHFSEALRADGYDVTGLDTATTVSQDCRDLFRLERTHRSLTELNGRWDLVVHCAAVVGGRAVIENSPLETAESLAIDAEMFRWAAVVKPKRVIYFSSSAAYPTWAQRDNTMPPLEENLIRLPELTGAPDEIYGWSKVTGELLADRLRRAGVPVTVVRPFSGYGEDQDPSYPFRAIIDRVKALEPGQPLELWCGDCTRDWIHVDDVVQGALAVARSFTEQPVNLCTGRPTSFMELAGLALRLAGKALGTRIVPNPEAPQGVAYRVGDPTRMLQFYQPTVSLAEGIERALAL
jgi:nucleoside-diphosphate-sugar epimerase